MSKYACTAVFAVIALALLVSLPIQSAAQGGVNLSIQNPLQVATLRWYPANLTTNIGLGSGALGPEAVAFDGQNLWFANGGGDGNSVTKIRPSDGTVLGTFTAGFTPSGLAFDGANIWVTNQNGGDVMKLRASDGTIFADVSIGGFLDGGIAFDGANIWVASRDGFVKKLRAKDAVVLGSFVVGPPGGANNGPMGIAFDGTNVWVTIYNSNVVKKLRASDGVVLGSFAVGSQPTGAAFDGTSVWVGKRWQ